MNNTKRQTHSLMLGTILFAASLNLHASTQIKQIGLTDSEHFVSGNYTSNRSFMNASGQVLGYAARYNGTTYNGQSAWLYDGNSSFEIGLFDAQHTSDSGKRYNQAGFLNNSGQVAGYTNRYNGGSTLLGRSAWLYDGSSSFQVGLTGVDHTRGSDNYQYNEIKAFNNAGQALGTARRYNSVTGAGVGSSSWLYNGATSVNVGLTDAAHTQTDGSRYSFSNLLNDAGQAAGVSTLYNGSTTGQTAWTYNGSNTIAIGLTDAVHTDADSNSSSGVQFINTAGQVLGHTQRYNGGSPNLGQSAWIYNGTGTARIGLTGAINTRNDGYQRSTSQHFNESGQAAGYSNRYSGSSDIGSAAWIYDGAGTSQIGLTDAAHTRSTDGYQSNFVDLLNNTGQAVGQSNLYSAGGGPIGSSAWLYNGTSSVEIGLVDAQHTAATNQRSSDVTQLNDAGQAAGNANRYNNSEFYYLGGQSAWAYNGTDTVQIGLTDAAHTKIRSNDADWQNNQVVSMNEAGQVAGYATRYGSSVDPVATTDILGQTAWLYDSDLDNTFSLLFSERSDGYAFSDIAYLGNDGLVLGSYQLFDIDDADLGLRVFSYTIDDGFFDLATLAGGLTTEGWQDLTNLLLTNGDGNGAGFLAGQGMLTSGENNALYLVSTSPVPVPATVWLFGSGLIGLISFARRKKA